MKKKNIFIKYILEIISIDYNININPKDRIEI